MSKIDREHTLSAAGLVKDQLYKIGVHYRLDVVEKPPGTKIPSDDLRGTYGDAMTQLVYLPENDRLEALRKGFCYGMMLRENKTTPSQLAFLDYISSDDSELRRPLLSAKEYILAIVCQEGGLIRKMTPEFFLYIASHFDLGTRLPNIDHFAAQTTELGNYILDVNNQNALIDAEGSIYLDTIARLHAKFLTLPEPEIIKQPKTVSKLEQPIVYTDPSKEWNVKQFRRKQKGGKRKREYLDEDDFD